MSKYLTPEGMKKIKKELEEFKTVKRREIAKRLKKAVSFGDLSENADYSQAKEDQEMMENRIMELEDIVRSSIVVSEKKNIGIVEIGSMVSVEHKGKKEEFKIVGSEEADPFKGEISIESPIGQALLNESKGAVVQVLLPKGTAEYKILQIK